MTDWAEHPEVFVIPDVTAECEAHRPTGKWRMVQYGSACKHECKKVQKKRANDWPQIAVIMRKLATTGVIRNEEQYKHEFDDIYAIKSRRGIRALGHLEARGNNPRPTFVILTWFEKQRKRLNRQQIQRVRNRRQNFETFIKEQCDEN